MTADVLPGQLNLLDDVTPEDIAPAWTPGERRTVPHPYQASLGVTVRATCSRTPGLLVSQLNPRAAWETTIAAGGWLVDDGSRTRAEALLLCDRLAGLTDWTSPTVAQTVACTPELQDRIHVARLSAHPRRAARALARVRDLDHDLAHWDVLHSPASWLRPLCPPPCTCTRHQRWAELLADSARRRDRTRHARDQLVDRLAMLTATEAAS